MYQFVYISIYTNYTASTTIMNSSSSPCQLAYQTGEKPAILQETSCIRHELVVMYDLLNEDQSIIEQLFY